MTGIVIAGVAVSLASTVRPVATYSIVARDAATGELGVAVQSHWFSVGSAVPWAEAGVGAVATQSFVELSYGPLGLDLMRAGKSASVALKALLAADTEEAVRQVAMVDAAGQVAAHTGARCIEAAGHQTGAGYSVQANLMAKPTVWTAMACAYEEAKGPFAERLLAALEAAEREGGDIRGRQSAAILIVKGKASGRPWADRRVDLRVEDNPAPLPELRRLVRLAAAYEAENDGDDRVAKADVAGAVAAYARAAELAPEIPELLFWQAVSLAKAGKLEAALPVFRRVFEREPRWRDLVPRLPRAGLLDADQVPKILE